jgi:hypothetical protein
MGPLTESMSRLCGEIVTLRGARLTFVRDLGQNVASQMADFHQARIEMARQTKAERLSFVKALADDVADMRAGFRQSHKEMARKSKAERRSSVARLKRNVGNMRRDFALDLAGAHRAWFGPSPEELWAKAEAERRNRAEAAQRAKEAAERERQITQTMAKQDTGGQHGSKEEAHRPGKKKS